MSKLLTVLMFTILTACPIFGQGSVKDIVFDITQGGIAYADADSLETTGACAANQIWISQGTSPPVCTTLTYLSTLTVNQVLYGTASNVLGSSANLTFNGSELLVTGDVRATKAGQPFVKLDHTGSVGFKSSVLFTDDNAGKYEFGVDLNDDGTNSLYWWDSSAALLKMTLGSTGLTMAGSSNNIALGSNYLSGDGGDEGVFVDSIGSVSIGAAVASSKLDVTTSGLGTTQSNTSGIALVNTTAAALNAQQISPAIRWRGFGWKTDVTAASQSVDFRSFVTPIQGAAAPTGRLDIQSSIAGAAYSDLMTITSAGNVGIGTASPTGKFHIENTSGDDVDDFVVDADGNVGIGTTNPSEKLDVKTTASGNILRLETSLDGGQVLLMGIDTTNKYIFFNPDASAPSYNITFIKNGGSAMMSLDQSSGNVGIGTTGPLAKLHVNGGVLVGVSPTGGDKGVGTINTAADIYKNNSAYTNPDYVFEKYYTGKIIQYADRDGADGYSGLKPITEVEKFAEINHHLPLVGRKPSGMFARGDMILASLEEAYLYLFELNRNHETDVTVLRAEITALERAIDELKKEVKR